MREDELGEGQPAEKHARSAVGDQEGNEVGGRALAVNSNTAPATEEQIRQRAYELYLGGGAQPGKETEHWLQAEAELNQENPK